MKIDIKILNLPDNKVQFKLSVSPSLKKYFLKDASYVQYDSSIDISAVGNSILAIPIVAAIAPIAWAVGADVIVPELDATYSSSLARVKAVYKDSHPNFSFSGNIQPQKEVTNRFGARRIAMLFSNGVDSLTSYLKHKQEKPDLFSIWGVMDIPPTEGKFWGRMWSDVTDLANQDGVKAFQIKTDVYRNINYELLGRKFGSMWWGGAAGGLFLLGMCAPLTAVRGTGTVIIASSYTRDFKEASAFHPSIDNNISWADVSVLHDGYELSRQQKLKYLCQNENLPYLSRLRVCWDSAHKTNCGNCEKCLRTIAGLALEGIDPNKCNFDIDTNTFSRLKDNFTKGKFKADAGLVYMWSAIQKHIPERINSDIKGSKEFLNWLRGFNISQYRANRLRHFLWMARLQYSNKRIKTEAILRKSKCYYYIILSKLGVV
jgi:hypothetical protein